MDALGSVTGLRLYDSIVVVLRGSSSKPLALPLFHGMRQLVLWPLCPLQALCVLVFWTGVAGCFVVLRLVFFALTSVLAPSTYVRRASGWQGGEAVGGEVAQRLLIFYAMRRQGPFARCGHLERSDQRVQKDAQLCGPCAL